LKTEVAEPQFCTFCPSFRFIELLNLVPGGHDSQLPMSTRLTTEQPRIQVSFVSAWITKLRSNAVSMLVVTRYEMRMMRMLWIRCGKGKTLSRSAGEALKNRIERKAGIEKWAVVIKPKTVLVPT